MRRLVCQSLEHLSLFDTQIVTCLFVGVEDSKQVNDFVREGLQMKDFHHPNVMELIGICWVKPHSDTLRPSSPLIVLPYMELSDLKTYLRRNRPGKRLSEKV